MSLKNNLFSLLFLASFLFNGLNATVEINSSNLFIPTSLDGVRLFHDENGFTVVKDGDEFPVKTECLDKELINLSDEDLDFVLGLKAKIEIDGEEQILTRISPELAQKLLTSSKELIQFSTEDSEKIVSHLPGNSYLQVFQFSDGEYGLHLHTRLPGGGPIFGHATYWIVKAVVGAVIVIGTGAIVVGTGAAAAAGLTTGAAIAGVTAATTLGVGGTVFATEAVATAAGLIVGCLPTP